ncbi:Very-long-chain 3-oxoacyl-CoA reductase-like protein [Emericellopsis cladophorae]|uniref:Very-long-chain 3-oxoacyl-CoA reductase n=1 Tax=Emericellopsis cladophorae TaxID=2686198 RepID=A0A9P9Y8N3_9HYPO|nr:Very-long-chain 3-oxoacyl-CoA reductase-like protein [Emericellopsis cladophorae]KAI6784814.1 Very-long-chain 3-oxoacyl-CoA reductase-like protein [Emericellopsis cladophorae]
MDSVCELLHRVPQPVQWGLAGVGVLAIGVKLLSYLQLLANVFILSGTSLGKYGKPGTWAVITGASDGLGKEYAYQLAQKGFNLILVSRTQSKLETLAKEIEAKHADKKVQTKIHAMDFSQSNNADYEALASQIEGLDVGILINNVGQSHSIPVSFLDTTQEEMESIIRINCEGTLKVTKVVAPILQKRRKGLILTMGSTAGWSPTPLLATYSGSKAFLQYWSSALAAELRPDNVDVYLVVSHLVTTAMSKIRRPSLMIPTAPKFVRSALSKIGNGGFQNASNTYTPWWTHSLMIWTVETVLGVFHPTVIGINRKMHVDIRKRALRKREREAKKQ